MGSIEHNAVWRCLKTLERDKHITGEESLMWLKIHYYIFRPNFGTMNKIGILIKQL